LAFARKFLDIGYNYICLAQPIAHDEFFHGLPTEDVKACKKVEEETGCTKDIRFITVTSLLGILVAEEDLWSYVAWGPALLEQKAIIVILDSQTKIGHLYLIVNTFVSDLVDQDVVRLDVSVDDLFLLEKV
jgi:hypothetical protein